jgi:membrane protein implicated in regulation of membrane protease activity
VSQHPNLLDYMLGAAVLYWAAMVVLFVVFAFVLPLMVFLIARNLKKMRLQLERLNDNIEGTDGGTGMLVRQALERMNLLLEGRTSDLTPRR